MRRMTAVTPAGFVWLASQSPRRRELLARIGITCRLLLPDADEDAEALEAERPGESPEDYVQRVTRAKLAAARARWARRRQSGAAIAIATAAANANADALARDQADADHVGAAFPPAPILCADTTVAVDDRILGKPVDADDALRMLRLLSGRRHRVLTAVGVADAETVGATGADAEERYALSTSIVTVAPLGAAALTAYLATGEPFGKAGAYGIQGAFAAWVERIEGSHSGIMGLPLFETAALLRAAGLAV